MKIVHICISNPYIDGWGYQENLLPQYLQKVGVQNYVIASANDYPSYLLPQKITEIKDKGKDYLIGEIHIKRIKTKRFTTSFLIPFGLGNTLEDIHPDVIFHHNFNCTSLLVSARYAKRNRISLLVDNHADVFNMSRNKLWAFVYYKVLIRITCRIHQKEIAKAYGVTHARCDFIKTHYGLPSHKIDFMPIGADIDLADTISSKASLRLKYGYCEEDFIVVSGGKMGKDKGTDALISVVGKLHESHPHLKLILFGSIIDVDVEAQATNSSFCKLIGWCDRIKTLELLKLADVACWPIHHTTLMEDAISVCTPIVTRKTGTTEHLIDGNGVWVENGSTDSVMNAILQLLHQNETQREELCTACESMKNKISYRTIAERLINEPLLQHQLRVRQTGHLE